MAGDRLPIDGQAAVAVAPPLADLRQTGHVLSRELPCACEDSFQQHLPWSR
eukprot:CAMPEP_0183559544 /NCGR_PEP_ID=MMETSP0371-20130417/92069_1 /TAXON_ID=268820 /ORGANISM="Peridinium aciculiferum, Strain PAER-2" /LENGTH=50 /DNA_ID=CAMNT_0025767411 /DNA_START=120 /DNA_END=269 /DNA_ORIENTATION=+